MTNITRTNYWDHPWVSQSKLKDLDPPALYYAKHIAKTVPQKDTAAMRKGRALHALLLEPESFDVRFPVFEGELRTAAAKAEYAQIGGAASMLDGCPMRDIKGDGGDLADIRAMVESIRRHPRASKLVDNLVVGSAEQPIAWEDPTTGIGCKARLDFIAKVGDSLALVDVKKTAEGGTKTDAIERAIWNYGYHLQAAHYRAGARANGFHVDSALLIFVEDAAPFCVRVVQLDGEAISRGESLRMARLDLLATCIADRRWPGPANDLVETVGLPRWAA